MARHDDVFEIASKLTAPRYRKLERAFNEAQKELAKVEDVLRACGMVTRDLSHEELLEWAADVMLARDQQLGVYGT